MYITEETLDKLIGELRTAFDQVQSDAANCFEAISKALERAETQVISQQHQITEHQKTIEKQQKEIKELQSSVADIYLTGTDSKDF